MQEKISRFLPGVQCYSLTLVCKWLHLIQAEIEKWNKLKYFIKMKPKNKDEMSIFRLFWKKISIILCTIFYYQQKSNSEDYYVLTNWYAKIILS